MSGVSFLLAKCRPGFEKEAWLALASLNLEAVEDVKFVLGDFDLVIIVKGNSDDVFKTSFHIREELGRRRLLLDTRTYLGEDPFNAKALIECIREMDELSSGERKGVCDDVEKAGDLEGTVHFERVAHILERHLVDPQAMRMALAATRSDARKKELHSTEVDAGSGR